MKQPSDGSGGRAGSQAKTRQRPATSLFKQVPADPTAPLVDDLWRGGPPPLRILVMADYNPWGAAMVCDHVNALANLSEHQVYVTPRVGDPLAGLDLDRFDVVVIHYSLPMAQWSYINESSRRKLRRFKGLKAAFIQDEYRFIADTTEALVDLGISLVFTCLPEHAQRQVYADPRLKGMVLKQVLTGYVPHWLTAYEPRSLRDRPVMVGYRGRTSPAWLGRAGREKLEIGRRFKREARQFGLRTDIDWSERGRLYGQAWTHFIRRCRAVLAVESGASVFDFDGRIASRSETFDILTRRGRRDEAADPARYEQIRQRFFLGQEDQIDISQISPRVFEAMALRTLVIAYKGTYSGVMEAWRHYVPLEKDHSNMAEVVAAVRDVDKSAEIIANAYAEIVLNPTFSFKTAVREFDRTIVKAFADRSRGEGVAYDPSAFNNKVYFVMVENPHSVAPLAGAQRLSTRVRMLARRLAVRVGFLRG